MSGLFAVHDASGLPPGPDACLGALRRLAHRGPAGEGLHRGPGLFLGVCASESHGDQPIVGAGGAVSLALDGRLVNRAALGGDPADERSDPALVLAAYLKHGEACFAKLRGIFAVVVWDERTRRLLLARDPLGVRPLYYHQAGGRMVVASEIKAILTYEPAARAVNHRRVWRLVHLGQVDDWADTCFAEVRPVPPGSIMRVEGARSTLTRYWTLAPAGERALDLANVREALVAAVEQHTPADVPVGLALSGGIDSAAIAGILARSPRRDPQRLRAFTITPPETADESPLIDATIRHTGIPHTYVSLDAVDYERLVGDLVDAHDEPVQSSGVLYQFALRRHMRQAGCRAVLVGYGADEIFAGYPAFAVPFLLSLLASGRLGDARRFILGAQALLEMPARRIAAAALERVVARRRSALVRAVKRTIGADPDASWRPDAGEVLAHGGGPADGADGASGFVNALVECVREHVPLLVRTEDRNAMAHGLDLCAPFMDQTLVEQALALPVHTYMAGGRNKAVLRDAVQGLLAPEVHAYPRKLATPGNNEHVIFDLLGRELRDLVRSTAFRASGLWSPECASLCEKDLARRRRASLWYRVYVVQKWHERVVSRSALGPGG